ncbi:MAG: 2-phospho-L-lactate guanylyltransferase [Candidatus Bathyarchaeia archaeon]
MLVSVFAAIPVKTLLKSKMRLSLVLNPKERQTLTLAMLEDVLKAVKRSVVRETVVISSERTVEELADNFAVSYLEERRHELNHAVKQATEWCIRNNASSVLILPADIPLVTSEDINRMVELCPKRACVVISPSQNGGTNALLRKPPNLIPIHFGPDSFRKHKAEALHKRIPIRVYRSERVAMDIDSPKDLEKLLEIKAQTASHRFLERIEADTRLKLLRVKL